MNFSADPHSRRKIGYINFFKHYAQTYVMTARSFLKKTIFSIRKDYPWERR